jgi:hypothetical protein
MGPSSACSEGRRPTRPDAPPGGVARFARPGSTDRAPMHACTWFRCSPRPPDRRRLRPSSMRRSTIWRLTGRLRAPIEAAPEHPLDPEPLGEPREATGLVLEHGHFPFWRSRTPARRSSGAAVGLVDITYAPYSIYMFMSGQRQIRSSETGLVWALVVWTRPHQQQELVIYFIL